MLEPTLSQEKAPTDLNFVSDDLNGHALMAMVDSGTNHNLLKGSVAKNLGLMLKESSNTFKEVNLQLDKVIGRAKEVSIKIGDWFGLINFMVVPMDDFDIVRELEFIWNTKETLVTYANNMAIFSSNKSLVIPMV